MRLRAVIEYDGTDFVGWQRQREGRTVQSEIERAIAALTSEATSVIGAGRTDAGVHATGQVAHFDTIWDRDAVEMRRALNAHLAPDVAIRDLDRAPAGFHARYSATGRRYVYAVHTGPVRLPLLRRTNLHVAVPLDVDRMARAAASLVGTFDFSAFGRPTSDGGPTTRRIERFDVVADSATVRLHVEGNAFLRHQVRRMVGLLLAIGRGAVAADAAASVLARSPGAPVAERAPAHGLTLVAVRYPPDEAIRTEPGSWGIETGV